MFPTYEDGLRSVSRNGVSACDAGPHTTVGSTRTLTNLTMAADGMKAAALNRYLKFRKG